MDDTSSLELAQMIEESASDPMLGATLKGKYRIVDQLGQGGMGTVYRARDLNLKRTVAVKILRDDFKRRLSKEAVQTFVERFKREAEVGSKLNHANIVQVFDFDVTDDGLEYLVIEYVPHRTLSEILDDIRYFRPKQAAAMISQVLFALEACRKADVVHRDLKPGNILIKDGDLGSEVKICDFGLGKLSSDKKNLTSAGVVVGTPRYLSPEQCKGVEADHRSDIYAVGIILYEALVGKTPFDGSPASVLDRHLWDTPKSPVLKADPGNQVPEELAEVVMKALRKNPDERYQTAGEMRQAIAEALSRSARKRATTSRTPAALVSVPARRVSNLLPWILATFAVIAMVLGFGYHFISKVETKPAEVSQVKVADAPKTTETKPVLKTEVTPPVRKVLKAPVPDVEKLPDTQDPDKLLSLADKYSLQGKTTLMAAAYERFLKVCGRHPKKRFVEKRLKAHRASKR